MGKMVPRDVRLRFWALIRAGLSTEDAASGSGVHPVTGLRWFQQAGGVIDNGVRPVSGRFLSHEEREEIMLRHRAGQPNRAIAVVLGRHCSTIGREIRRNAMV